MTDIVLVHGAFHGGWCWRDVIPLLAARGHRVLAPTLTGLGERRHLLTAAVNLETHVEDILQCMVVGEVRDGVLVCHSYGGMPGLCAADRAPERLRALVWLDAFVPEDGRSGLDLRNSHAEVVPLEPPAGLTLPALPPEAFGLEGADADWVRPLLTPHPLATVTQAARLGDAWRGVPVKHYHRALRYRAGYFDAMALAAQAEGWQVGRHDMAHDMMVTEPEWTADAILAVTA